MRESNESDVTPAGSRRDAGRGGSRESNGDEPIVDGEASLLTEFEQLIVVSNREPYRHEFDDATSDGGTNASIVSTETSDAVGAGTIEPSSGTSVEVSVDRPAGGLTAALDPVVQRVGGTWIAWGDGDADRSVSDDDGRVAVPPENPSYTLQRMWLDESDVDGYYYGFSNRVLWPLCHDLPTLIDNRSGDFGCYRDVNERFATAIAEHVEPDSLVWLQDYHFAIAPRLLAERVPGSVTIGHFWHVPWPDPAVFTHCPHGESVLEGLLGNDLLGFHVPAYVRSFLETVDRFLPAASVDFDDDVVRYDGTTTAIVADPLGIDAAEHDHIARGVSPERFESLRERYDVPEDVAIGLGVDRLDYTKGLPERLSAIERFFDRNPNRCETVTFVQTTSPSRTDIPAYEALGTFVRGEVERINDRFATDEWRPIVYTEEYLSRVDLATLYRYADVLVVTSLRDGMNLVGQEFVASSVDGTGSIVLSRETGLHTLVGEQVHSVDPVDTDGVADAIEAALTTPTPVERRRMTRMRHHLFEHDVERWMDSQFDRLSALARDADPSLVTERSSRPGIELPRYSSNTGDGPYTDE